MERHLKMMCFRSQTSALSSSFSRRWARRRPPRCRTPTTSTPSETGSGSGRGSTRHSSSRLVLWFASIVVVSMSLAKRILSPGSIDSAAAPPEKGEAPLAGPARRARLPRIRGRSAERPLREVEVGGREGVRGRGVGRPTAPEGP